MRLLWVAAVLLAGTAVAAGPAHASDARGIQSAEGSAPVDLYFHVDGFQDFPMSTQAPPADHQDSPSLGLATHSGCAPENPATVFATTGIHTWYGYHARDGVTYDPVDGSLGPHPLRGPAADIRLDVDRPLTVHWFMEAQAPGLEDVGVQAPLVVPDVTVRAQLRASDEISVDHEAVDSAPLIATAQVGPVTLSPVVDDPAVTHHEVDGRHVYGFHFPLDILSPVLPADTGYMVRIDAWMDNPYCTGDQYITPDVIRPYIGHGLWSRMRMHVEDPISIKTLHVAYAGDELVFTADARSQFGGYDAETSDIVIDGPTTPTALQEFEPARVNTHEGPRPPLSQRTWSWNFTADEARPGLYDVTFTASNLQATANATAHAVFELGDDSVRICQEAGIQMQCDTFSQAEQVPMPLALLPLLAALLLRRRSA